jgi:hypothetical protein
VGSYRPRIKETPADLIGYSHYLDSMKKLQGIGPSSPKETPREREFSKESEM